MEKEAKQLKRELSAMGMTYGDLAKKLGVTAKTITTWTKGYFYPSPKHVKAMMDIGITKETAVDPSRVYHRNVKDCL